MIRSGTFVEASASEYYGGYGGGGGGSYGGVGGFDDFYGGGGYHGGYHHSPPYRHHHKSSKGPLALLLGLLPLGLLFASIVPSLYSLPFAGKLATLQQNLTNWVEDQAHLYLNSPRRGLE